MDDSKHGFSGYLSALLLVAPNLVEIYSLDKRECANNKEVAHYVLRCTEFEVIVICIYYLDKLIYDF